LGFLQRALDRMFGIAVHAAIDYSRWAANPLRRHSEMSNFRSDGPTSRALHEALASVPSVRRLMRAAGNIRILLFATPGRPGAGRTTRPVATGTFSYPAFASN
jgi:hypothetical protein